MVAIMVLSFTRAGGLFNLICYYSCIFQLVFVVEMLMFKLDHYRFIDKMLIAYLKINNNKTMFILNRILNFCS